MLVVKSNVRWSNAFEKTDIGMTVLFRTVDDYIIKEAYVKRSGSKQERLEPRDVDGRTFSDYKWELTGFGYSGGDSKF